VARLLTVNADDFGFTRDVNDGIITAHRDGILTATTLMANGDAFQHAVALARETPTLDIGVHCVMVQGRSVLDPSNELPRTVTDLIGALVRGRVNPYDELKAQIERILAAGIKPTHLDTHKHTHLLPPVLNAVARLSQEYGIRWVRRPFDLPIQPDGVPFTKRTISRAMGSLRTRFHRVLSAHGCRTTDHFAGFQITGRFTANDVATLIRALPEGSTEFMCHPGFCRDELQCAATRLKESREAELKALVSLEAKKALAESGVKLVSYSELNRLAGA
jgi:predicted glycoside hydrolase/deacetylase ChbG (UPF0249 family)